jgi:micrococcal nuclease
MKQNLKKLLTFAIMSVFLLVVVWLDPDGDILKSFDENFEKTSYFENCVPEMGVGTNSASTTQNSASSTTNSLLEVVRVVDGDTIEVNDNCEPLTVRLIGINTPETLDPRKPVECFGIESSNYAKSLLENTKVKIEIDPSQGERDKYGRYLGYVIMEDGTNYNLKMLEQGFAYEYTYNTPYKYQSEFKKAQADAQASGKGLWSAATCNGLK